MTHPPQASPEQRVTAWGDVFWRYVQRGHDRSSAAYQADLWERSRRCPAELVGQQCACQDAGMTTSQDTCDFATEKPHA
jgi:hypothetical protein